MGALLCSLWGCSLKNPVMPPPASAEELIYLHRRFPFIEDFYSCGVSRPRRTKGYAICGARKFNTFSVEMYFLGCWSSRAPFVVLQTLIQQHGVLPLHTWCLSAKSTEPATSPQVRPNPPLAQPGVVRSLQAGLQSRSSLIGSSSVRSRLRTYTSSGNQSSVSSVSRQPTPSLSGHQLRSTDVARSSMTTAASRRGSLSRAPTLQHSQQSLAPSSFRSTFYGKGLSLQRAPSQRPPER